MVFLAILNLQQLAKHLLIIVSVNKAAIHIKMKKKPIFESLIAVSHKKTVGLCQTYGFVKIMI